MIERHYDDESLIALMESPLAGRHDGHVPGCSDCSGRIAEFASIASMLEESETWDMREFAGEPQPASVSAIRAFAARMEDEDAVAVALAERLLIGPRELWTRALRQNRESRTAGVVRRLLTLAYDAVVTMPPDAVEMTALASEIADGLDAEFDPTVHQLRGAAWRDRAYALYYTSRFEEALAACDRADAAFSYCVVDEWDRARVGIVRSLVLRAFEKLDDAEAIAASGSEVFAKYEDVDRRASAAMTQAHLLMSRENYAAAERILSECEHSLRNSSFAETHGRVLSNLAHCSIKLGKLDAATRYFDLSFDILDSVGTRTEALRNRWSLATLLADHGKREEAVSRYRPLIEQFKTLGLPNEVARCGLELAELLIVDQKFAEVAILCREAIASFERSGTTYTRPALLALAYLQEAAEQERVAPAMVREVREYIRKLPERPNLLFAPRPDDFLQPG